MKGFKRENRLLSLCGLNCGLCTHVSGQILSWLRGRGRQPAMRNGKVQLTAPGG